MNQFDMGDDQFRKKELIPWETARRGILVQIRKERKRVGCVKKTKEVLFNNAFSEFSHGLKPTHVLVKENGKIEKWR